MMEDLWGVAFFQDGKVVAIKCIKATATNPAVPWLWLHFFGTTADGQNAALPIIRNIP